VTRLAVFDCDGTLVDSGATILAAVAETFGLHGLAVPPPRVCRGVIGYSLVEAMATLVPEAAPEDHVRFAETYKKCFFRARQEGRVEEPLFDGVVALLDALEGDGWLLAVATGKSDRGLKHCLESHGIHARFVSLQTADRHPSKPHPSMAEQAIAEAGASPGSTVVIGDTAFDMGMARAAGTGALGAGWGYHDADELFAGGAHAVAEAPRAVMAILPELMERIDG
jgi:phosphoglycolate phosphatase